MRILIKISRVVIVEGKYDKIRLSNIIDAVIITTDGFRIFKNAEKRLLIKRLSEEKGLLVITDSDKAGCVIRAHIKSFAKDADIVNVYLPQIVGKEKRKSVPSAEGFLGVEGIPDEIIRKALMPFSDNIRHTELRKIEKSDLYNLGLSGRSDSKNLRENFLGFLALPKSLTTNALLDALNSLYTFTEFSEVIKKWQQDLDKN